MFDATVAYLVVFSKAGREWMPTLKPVDFLEMAVLYLRTEIPTHLSTDSEILFLHSPVVTPERDSQQSGHISLQHCSTNNLHVDTIRGYTGYCNHFASTNNNGLENTKKGEITFSTPYLTEEVEVASCSHVTDLTEALLELLFLVCPHTQLVTVS
ncbi:hypothetical protein MAR_010802 [Mya arenaria]|uniref:Uncharacterized protein n=1 Tax=Mya arenaria TaxID=6604 RepID=A0ABY7FS94_MYAAR|nr:hypothetical protein MAR_010802 [Mya arenaria]